MSTSAPIPELPGTEERAAPGPVRHKGPGPAASGWLDPRGRAIGGRTFALHRLTGLALLLYLYVHLGVLSMLLVGESAWDDFLGVVTAKGFLAFDVVLIFGLLFHALNGIRVALVGSGYLVAHQRALFWAATAIGAPALIYAALHILGGV
jgi:succinate dehydrogenase / fumarate reductase cytochrome b subunit